MSSPFGASPLNAAKAAFTRRNKMSITQTYYLAHTARGKLSMEASRADHNLRLLVGHANLLDSLMLDLAEAEQEQENWFNQSVKGASTTKQSSEAPRRIQWADAVVRDEEEDDDMSSDSDDSDYDEDEEVKLEAAATMVNLHRVSARPIPSAEYESDEEEEDDDEDFAALTLTKTTSHAHQPPDLMEHDEEDSSSDDEAMPPSPPSAALPTFDKKPRAPKPAVADHDYMDKTYYSSSRRPSPGLVSAISVY